jgi:aminoglycoside phosphotransferase (APT) family kinase protein
VDALAGMLPAIELAVAALEPGGRVLRASALTGGVSANVVGLHIATVTGERRRAVFRQHRDPDVDGRVGRFTAKEFTLLGALHQQGFPVPEPYFVDASGTATPPYLITEWIDGSTDIAPADLPSVLEQMAGFLTALHGVDLDAESISRLEMVEDPAAAIITYLPDDQVGQRIRAALATGDFSTAAAEPVVLHGDYWPGNMLWRNGRLAAVIDWEDACLGDPLADLATARVELLCWFGPAATERFTAHYLAMRQRAGEAVALDRLPLWEMYVSASALAAMHDWGLDPAEESKRRHLTDSCFRRAAHQFLGA